MGVKHSLSAVVCCCQPCKAVSGNACLEGLEEEGTGALDFAQAVPGHLQVTSLSVISWGPGNAPAGKLFEETLQDVSRLDRYLMLFSASSSLTAVRWLLKLGASRDICDANGSTCLHAACRSGSLAVVMELIRHPPLLEAADSANWTPLHIAAHMGRRKVVIQLLKARASPHCRNNGGQTPVQLCLDMGTREALGGTVGPRPLPKRRMQGRTASRNLVSQLSASARPPPGAEPAPDWLEDDDDEDAEDGDGVPEEADDIDRHRPAGAVGGDGPFIGGLPLSLGGGADGLAAPVRRPPQPRPVPPQPPNQPMEPGEEDDGEEEDDDEDEDRVGVPVQCEPELFFVTPSPVVKHVGVYRKAVLQLAVRIFNLHPSYGIGFAVLSGLADNYTGAMKAVLRTTEVNRERAGIFLGETLSVCHLIRFGVLDSLAFLHTSVVAALTLAFRSFRLPSDLQKVHRLVHSVAIVWWRKHRALAREGFEMQKGWFENGEHDLAGLGLLQYLASSDVLSQLMLSTLLLHWYMHGCQGHPGRPITLEEWMMLNRGIEEGGNDVPEFVQQQIYNSVSRQSIPELECSPLGDLTAGPGAAPACEGQQRCRAAEGGDELLEEWGEDQDLEESPHPEDAGPLSLRRQAPSALYALSSMEGWLQLLGGAIPCPAPGRVDSDVGELTMSTWSDIPLGTSSSSTGGVGGGSAAALVTALAGSPGPPSEGYVWASICSVFLLFALSPLAGSPAAAPHVVADARRLRVSRIDLERAQMRLEAVPGGESSPSNVPSFQLALLLPDGRWRELSADHLDVRTASVEELRKWEAAIVRTRAATSTDV